MVKHKMMLPPRARGTVTWVAAAGHYTVTDKILEMEFDGENGGGLSTICVFVYVLAKEKQDVVNKDVVHTMSLETARACWRACSAVVCSSNLGPVSSPS